MKRIPGLETYFGGKGGDGVFQTIINHMPPHKIYIETFLGGGSIMLHKRPAEVNIGIEVDPNVSSLWRQHLPPYMILIEGNMNYKHTFALDFTVDGNVMV